MAINIVGTVDSVPGRRMGSGRVSQEILDIESAAAQLDKGKILKVSFAGVTGEGEEKDAKRAGIRAVTLRKRAKVANAQARGTDLYVEAS